MSITITEQAATRIAFYLKKRGSGIGLRIGIRRTGCSGMAYKLEYADQSEPEDKIFINFGIKIIVDPKSFLYLDGTELDYTKTGLSEGFQFRNPNEKNTCGCGESFTV